MGGSPISLSRPLGTSLGGESNRKAFCGCGMGQKTRLAEVCERLVDRRLGRRAMTAGTPPSLGL